MDFENGQMMQAPAVLPAAGISMAAAIGLMAIIVADRRRRFDAAA